MYLGLIILSFLMVFRAKKLYTRLRGVHSKRLERKELQTVNYINKLKFLYSDNKPVEAVIDPKKKQLKRIVNLNKNVMSLLLPYLNHEELLNVECTIKQMAVFVNFWPVWKNIYYEQHLKNARLPGFEKTMTDDE